MLYTSGVELFTRGEYLTNAAAHCTSPRRGSGEPEVLPGVWVLGQGSQAAGVHVPSYIDVHWSVRLGELSWERNSLGSQRRNRGAC